MTTTAHRQPLAPFVAVLALACADEPPASVGEDADDTGVVDDTGSPPGGLYPLTSLDWGEDTDDLAPLDDVVGSAQVVALGESVHFSGGYHQARARLIPYLVESLGFRAVAFEGPWMSAEDGRPYVEECEGDIYDAIEALYFSVWQSEQSALVLEWLCEWNAAHPDDPVHFWGFDIQEPWRDGYWLRRLMADADGTGTSQLIDGVSDCFGAGYDDIYEVYADKLAYAVLAGEGEWPAERSERCVETLPLVEEWVDAHEADIVEQHGDEGPAFARIALAAIEAAHVYYTALDASDPTGWDARDAGMAEVFLSLWDLRAPDEKVVIFAHNAHIVAAGEEITASAYPDGWLDMGSHLGQKLDEAYAPIGFVAHTLDYNWPGYPTQTSVAGADALESRLLATGEPYLLVDLAETSVIPADTAFQLGHPGYGTMVPAEHYRGLVYLGYSPEMETWHGR